MTLIYIHSNTNNNTITDREDISTDTRDNSSSSGDIDRDIVTAMGTPSRGGDISQIDISLVTVPAAAAAVTVVVATVAALIATSLIIYRPSPYITLQVI